MKKSNKVDEEIKISPESERMIKESIRRNKKFLEELAKY